MHFNFRSAKFLYVICTFTLNVGEKKLSVFDLKLPRKCPSLSMLPGEVALH